MRVLVLHESPGTDEIAAEFTFAAEEFNRGLDIRLRFLEVGFELRRLAVSPEDDGIAPQLEAVLRRFQPSVILVLGRGSRLLECVATAAKSGARIAFLLNSEPDRTSTAIAHMSRILVTPPGGPAISHPPAESLHQLDSDSQRGKALVGVLVTAGRGR